MSFGLPFKRSSVLASIGATAVIAMLPFAAKARVVSTDDFETVSHPAGNRTVTAGGTTGIRFFTRNATGGSYSVGIVDDSAAGGLGSKGLSHTDTTTSSGGNAVIGLLSENVSLANTGDFITLSFRFRLTNVATATANSAGFRFGLHSSTGSPVSGDDQGAQSDNDVGYYILTGVGSASAPATTGTLFVENGGTSPILGGTDRTALTSSTTGAVINDNLTHSATFTVTRTNATTIGLSAAYDGGTAITSSTTTLRTLFDEVSFGDGFVASPANFILDDVQVNAVPEPAAAGLLAAGAGVLALRHRRRATVA